MTTNNEDSYSGYDRRRDRDVLIRVEQQLDSLSKLQTSTREDLKEIFNRIEQDSKTVTIIDGNLKSHLESSIIRWGNLEKRLVEMESKLILIDEKIEDNAESITKEREDRVEALNDQKQEFKTFKEKITSSFATVSWIVGLIASAATFLGVFNVVAK